MTLTWVDQLARDVPPLLASIIVAAGVVVALSFFLVRPEDRTRVAVLVLGVAVIGAVAGFAGGTSRTGVVGEVIPAALALLGGGLAVYLFGVDLSKGTLASVCAGAFALALGLGYTMGAGTRGPSERYATWTEACRDVFMAHETLAATRRPTGPSASSANPARSCWRATWLGCSIRQTPTRPKGAWPPSCSAWATSSPSVSVSS